MSDGGVFGNSSNIGISLSDGRASAGALALATADLSSGVARSNYPFELCRARGAIQPELGLQYSSADGNREAGLGWGLHLPCIERKNLSGSPTYLDPPPAGRLDPSIQDRFVFAGQALVPVMFLEQQLGGTSSNDDPSVEHFPLWALRGGWHYFRLQVDTMFARFFWSGDHNTWRIQFKSGETMELGVPLVAPFNRTTGADTGGIDIDSKSTSSSGDVFRWNLVRRYDSQGGDSPTNIIAFQWAKLGRHDLGFLTDIFDTPDESGGESVDGFAHHTQLSWEPHGHADISTALVWRATPDLRLKQVEVASRTFDGTGPREMVRRYHLEYQTAIHHSLLVSVQMEGRPDPQTSVASRLPPTRMFYNLPSTESRWVAMEESGGRPVTGVRDWLTSTAAYGVPNGHADPHYRLTTLIDVDGDGLPDLVQPAIIPDLKGALCGALYLNSNGNSARTLTYKRIGCTAGPRNSSRVDAPNTQTVLGSPVLDNMSVLGDWSGDGHANLLWIGEGESSYTGRYASRELRFFSAYAEGGDWNWKELDSGETPNTENTLYADIDGDGLTDVFQDRLQVIIQYGHVFKENPAVYFTVKSADGFIAPFKLPATLDIADNRQYSDFTGRSTDNRVMGSGETPFFALADMNGDGLPELVGYFGGDDEKAGISYFPGNGLGQFGDRVDLSGDPPVEMPLKGTKIQEGNGPPIVYHLHEDAHLHDINGDGMADLITAGDALLVRWNLDGRNFTAPIAIDWPFPHGQSTGFQSVIDTGDVVLKFADMNGSGVDNVVLLAAGTTVYYLDLFSGVKPGLLLEIDNGLGARTKLEYTSTTDLAREARTAGNPWATQSAQVMHVVRRVVVFNTLPVNQSVRRETLYQYRNPIYDGWERRFRGFRDVVVTHVGDADAPTSSTETFFQAGTCENPSDPCPANKNDDEPLKAISALPVLIDRFDEQGNYLSRVHNEYVLADMYHGMDGRTVRGVFPSQTDTYLFGVVLDEPANPGSGSTETVKFVDVVHQTNVYRDGIGIKQAETGKNPGGPNSIILGTRHVRLHYRRDIEHLRVSRNFDPFGNEVQVIDHGRIINEDTPVDRPIRVDTEMLVTGSTRWQWRTKTNTVHAFLAAPGEPIGMPRVTHFEYDDFGNLKTAHVDLIGTMPLDRFHEDPSQLVAPTPAAASTDGKVLLFTNKFDRYGNVTSQVGTDGKSQRLLYDVNFNHLLVEIRDDTGSAAVSTLNVTRRFDRGLEAVTERVASNSAVTAFDYDSFGRLLQVYGPDPDTPGATTHFPTLKLQYFVTEGAPIQMVRTQVQSGTPGEYREGWIYVDGLGSEILSLSQADPSAGDGGKWIASGLPRRSRKGLVVTRYVPWFYDGDPSAYPFWDQPAGASIGAVYDPFDRIATITGADGSLVERHSYGALSFDIYDAGDLVSAGPHEDTPLTVEQDGHGRTISVTERIWGTTGLDEVVTRARYHSTGEMFMLTQSHSSGPEAVVRWMLYDSMGRMVLNADPNTATNFKPFNASEMKAWRYAYNDSGQVVGTSDARGGGQNFFYDVLGRLIAESYSPCENGHVPYTEPNLENGDSTAVFYRYDLPDPGQSDEPPLPFSPQPPWETFLRGRLSSVSDRGAHTRFLYDGRAHVVGISRRLAKPGTPAQSLGDRYAKGWFKIATRYDLSGRVVRGTTGAETPELLGSDGESAVAFTYSARGTVRSVEGSYGTLLAREILDADGSPLTRVFGDLAASTTEFSYDPRRRLKGYWLARPAPLLWSLPHGGYSPPAGSDPTTLQLILVDTAFAYDEVSNPTLITDFRHQDEWPRGAKPSSMAMQYDDLYRLTQVTYNQGQVDDAQISPQAAEELAGDKSVIPNQGLPRRVQLQEFDYDWRGNVMESHDDAQAFFNRSLGSITYDPEHPDQLKSAGGRLAAHYDAAGNLVDLIVDRSGSRADPSTKQVQRYVYNWDEVGRLARARRWDYVTLAAAQPSYPKLPTSSPTVDLSYAYSGKQRVLKSALVVGATERYWAEVFPTLRLANAGWDGAMSDYERTATTEIIYLGDLGRVEYSPPQVPTGNGQRQHVFLTVTDQLGSHSVTIDQATSEVVQRTTYQAFGSIDSDYRPTRWGSARNAYGFDGKELDAEAGILYFGARYYHPQLGRWLSPDPLAVHSAGNRINAYAFVDGSPLKRVDVNGLDDGSGCLGLESNCGQGIDPGGQDPGDVPSVTGPPSGSAGAPSGSGSYVPPYVPAAQPSPPKPVVDWQWMSTRGIFGETSSFLPPTWLSGNFSFPLSLTGTIYDPMANPVVSLRGLATGAANELLEILAEPNPLFGSIPLYSSMMRSLEFEEPTGQVNGSPDHGPALGHFTITMMLTGVGELGVLNEVEAANVVERIHAHHVYPQGKEFAAQWERVGIKIDQWCVELSESVHLGQIHGSADLNGVGPGGVWNENWRQFFASPGVKSLGEIETQGQRMLRGFGIPANFVPCKKRWW